MIFQVLKISSQSIEIECEYSFDSPERFYQCGVFDLIVTDDRNQTFIMTGEHLPNQSDDDVRFVHIYSTSSVPLIIPHIIVPFPNLITPIYGGCGLKTIQPGDFRNFQLSVFVAFNNSELTSIPAGAFAGAFNLESLQIYDNAIEHLHVQAFAGLHRLNNLNLNRNKIRVLHPDVFRTLPRLEVLSISSNELSVLPGRLVANNKLLNNIFMSDNNITAIDRTFLDPLRNQTMGWWFIMSNHCVNFILNFWTMSSDRIDDFLRVCHDRYDEMYK